MAKWGEDERGLTDLKRQYMPREHSDNSVRLFCLVVVLMLVAFGGYWKHQDTEHSRAKPTACTKTVRPPASMRHREVKQERKVQPPNINPVSGVGYLIILLILTAAGVVLLMMTCAIVVSLLGIRFVSK